MAKLEKPHATVLMREPNGKQSSISVHLTEKGCDLVFSRSSHGELLVMLPAYAAKELGEALITAVGSPSQPASE
jgi:hypothetical protein